VHASSSGSGGCSGSSCPGPLLISAGLDGRVIQWDLSGGGPAAVQSVLATAGADARSELTAMAHLQVASILATGMWQCCMGQLTARCAVTRRQAFCVIVATSGDDTPGWSFKLPIELGTQCLSDWWHCKGATCGHLFIFRV
jgi:hypothetical protein